MSVEMQPVPGVAAQQDRGDWRRVCAVMFAVGWGAGQFAPMLVVYHSQLHLPERTLDLLFAVYAIGLVPGLLVGGAASDRLGRRPLVRLFAALSPPATLIVMLPGHSISALAVGRLLAGACSGVVFGIASAWVQELSGPTATAAAARRATVWLSAGFGSGPLVAGALAQFAAHRLWFPYAPHLAIGIAALALVWNVPETVTPNPARPVDWRPPRAVRSTRFVWIIVPLAPWVFGLASFAGVALPAQLGHAGGYAVLIAGLANAVALAAGVLIQPVAHRLEARERLLGARIGVVVGAGGILSSLVLLQLASPALVLLGTVPMGAAYGMIMVSGLREAERLADPLERGATAATFLTLAYLGFAVPYAVSALNQSIGRLAAFLIVAAAMCACGLVSGAAARTS